VESGGSVNARDLCWHDGLIQFHHARHRAPAAARHGDERLVVWIVALRHADEGVTASAPARRLAGNQLAKMVEGEIDHGRVNDGEGPWRQRLHGDVNHPAPVCRVARDRKRRQLCMRGINEQQRVIVPHSLSRRLHSHHAIIT
jgi:hypothetical protein